MNEIARKIKMLRVGKGILEKDIAERMSISRPAYSNMERDVTKLYLERFVLIARIHNLKPEELWALDAEQLLRISLARGGGGNSDTK